MEYANNLETDNTKVYISNTMEKTRLKTVIYYAF